MILKKKGYLLYLFLTNKFIKIYMNQKDYVFIIVLQQRKSIFAEMEANQNNRLDAMNVSYQNLSF